MRSVATYLKSYRIDITGSAPFYKAVNTHILSYLSVPLQASVLVDLVSAILAQCRKENANEARKVAVNVLKKKLLQQVLPLPALLKSPLCKKLENGHPL